MKSQKKMDSIFTDYEELENLLLCARWLVHQFENIELPVLSQLFEQALNDSEIWVENMIENGFIEYKSIHDVKEREAKAIHNILIKYASIDDDEVRESILSKMLHLTKKSYN